MYTLGFLEILALVFTFAKLAGFIDWSWWVALSPLLAEGVLVVIIAFCLLATRPLRKLPKY
jgi:hypothetical protein